MVSIELKNMNLKNRLIGFHADFERISSHCPKTAFGYKIEVSVIFSCKLNFSQFFEMNIKKWVDISSWNLLKEDDKVYEEEILEIKAKYGDEVTEDQIEGNTFLYAFL